MHISLCIYNISQCSENELAAGAGFFPVGLRLAVPHSHVLFCFFHFENPSYCVFCWLNLSANWLKAFPVGLFCQFSRKRSVTDWPEFKPHDTNTRLQHPHWYLISSHMILSLRCAFATIILADMPDRIVLVGSKSIQYHSSSYSVSFAL